MRAQESRPQLYQRQLDEDMGDDEDADGETQPSNAAPGMMGGQTPAERVRETSVQSVLGRRPRDGREQGEGRSGTKRARNNREEHRASPHPQQPEAEDSPLHPRALLNAVQGQLRPLRRINYDLKHAEDDVSLFGFGVRQALPADVPDNLRARFLGVEEQAVEIQVARHRALRQEAACQAFKIDVEWARLMMEFERGRIGRDVDGDGDDNGDGDGIGDD